MQQAIEKLVRNEIGTQEKIELVHDLAVETNPLIFSSRNCV